MVVCIGWATSRTPSDGTSGHDGILSRDLIDLAMLNLDLARLRQALAKAKSADGQAIRRDLNTAIERMHQRHGWLERCMQAMAMQMPKAVLWQKGRALRRVVPKV